MRCPMSRLKIQTHKITSMKKSSPSTVTFMYANCTAQTSLPSEDFCFSYDTSQLATHLSAGISASRPEISLKASAQRDVESAIMDTL